MAVAWNEAAGGDDLGRVWRVAWSEGQRYDGLIGWARLSEVAARSGVAAVVRPLPRGVPCVVARLGDETSVALADWLIENDAETALRWHALGHAYLEHSGVQVCHRAPRPGACQAASVAGLALSIPAAFEARGSRLVARLTGQPPALVALWRGLGRRYGTLAGRVDPRELADAVTEGQRWLAEALDAAVCPDCLRAHR